MICPPCARKPAPWSSSRNGGRPGGTIVLKTTSVPLDMISSTVFR